jgi:hypothetical protein
VFTCARCAIQNVHHSYLLPAPTAAQKAAIKSSEWAKSAARATATKLASTDVLVRLRGRSSALRISAHAHASHACHARGWMQARWEESVRNDVRSASIGAQSLLHHTHVTWPQDSQLPPQVLSLKRSLTSLRPHFPPLYTCTAPTWAHPHPHPHPHPQTCLQP